MDQLNWDELDQILENSTLPRNPNDGLPVFPDLETAGVSLDGDERLVLGQIVEFGGKWSIDNLIDLHKQLITAFESETGVSYTPDMGKLYVEPIRKAFESLKRKQLIEPVPGQSGPETDATHWQPKAD